MSDSWLWMTAADLGRGIARGRHRPARADRGLSRARSTATPQAPAIYARTTPERARAEAAAAAGRARAGLRRGPLDGVPVSWKDLFDTAGIATEAGSALLAGRVPERDAAVLATATRAGLVCLGKTHLTELAFSGLGLNPVTATPPNINDPELAPGGSSSGAAASVAFGLAAAAIGSDTAGSVRVPAAWNDLVGLKTTHGALPLDGVVPLRPASTPSGRSAARSRTRRCCSPPSAAAARPTWPAPGSTGVRLLVLDAPDVLPTRAGPRAAFETAVDRLAAAGARIERGAPPAVAAALALWPAICAPEAYATWRDAIEARPEVMFAPVRDRFRAGAGRAADDYIAARRRSSRVRRRVAGGRRRLRRGRAADHRQPAPRGRAPASPTPTTSPTENLLALRNTRLANLLGLCALTAPDRHPRLRPDAMAARRRRGPACCASARAVERAPWHSAPQNAGPRGACRLQLRRNGALETPADEATDAVSHAVLGPAGIRLSATAAAARGHAPRAAPSSP